MTFRSQLRKLMEAHGFELIRGGHHLVWRNPTTGQQVFTATTPSCRYALKNVERSIKRYAS